MVRAQQRVGEEWPSCLWLARGGMRWNQLSTIIELQLRLSGKHPRALLIHLGSNDLGHLKSSELYLNIHADLLRLRLLLPDTTLVWSSILPRKHWMGVDDFHAMEIARRKLTRRVANRIRELGGVVVQYPNITATAPDMHCWDGVHLSKKGLSHFVNCIYQAIHPFTY